MSPIHLRIDKSAIITIHPVNDNGVISGTITSNLHTDKYNSEAGTPYDHAIDGLESLVLAHYCAGINVQDNLYIKGIQVALESIDNNL